MAIIGLNSHISEPIAIESVFATQRSKCASYMCRMVFASLFTNTLTDICYLCDECKIFIVVIIFDLIDEVFTEYISRALSQQPGGIPPRGTSQLSR